MRRLLIACAVLAPVAAFAGEPGKLSEPVKPPVTEANSAAARAVQEQEVALLRQISSEVQGLRNDIRCIRIRASGGAC